MIRIRPKEMVLKKRATAFLSKNSFGISRCKFNIYWNGYSIGCGKSAYAAWLDAARRI